MFFNERDFRNALGKFATGICVVCGTTREGVAVGMTINSFASVSLNPALVLWSIKNNSISHRIFSQLERYSINVLAESQRDISNFYAKPGDHVMSVDHLGFSPEGIPCINDAIARFDCLHWRSYSAGDHDVIIAEVIGYRSETDRVPAIYFEGTYHTIATN